MSPTVGVLYAHRLQAVRKFLRHEKDRKKIDSARAYRSLDDLDLNVVSNPPRPYEDAIATKVPTLL